MTTKFTEPKKQMGQVLVEHGLTTQDQLEQALLTQKSGGHNKLLGETIVEMKFCTEHGIVEALAEAYGMPYAQLTPRLIDPHVID